MATVQLNITGGTYKSVSLPLSAQVCRNFKPKKIDNENALTKYMLDSYHGLKLFSSGGSEKDRGMHEHNGVVYKITGSTLYSVSSTGTQTSVGTIYGSNRCIFASVGTDLVINSGTTRYLLRSGVLSIISDTDLEAGYSVASLNTRAIYDGLNGRFWQSDVAAPENINALNYGTAEGNSDDLVRVYAFGQIAYMMGSKTIELYYDSSEGNPTLTRYQGAVIEVGLGAIHSVATDESSLFFVGDDKQVYVIKGGVTGSVTRISNGALSEEFSKYDVSDAIGWTTQLDGEWEYHLTFPSENKTWVYAFGGEWFELSSGDEGGRNIANSYVYSYGKHLVADYRNGNIYELDKNTFTENGETIIRTRVTSPLHGALFNAAGKTLWLDKLELHMENGVGLVSGQGSDPEIMMRYSDDGGRTWSKQYFGKIGKVGEFTKEVYWTSLGSFKTRIFEFSASDAVPIRIYYSSVELKVGV